MNPARLAGLVLVLALVTCAAMTGAAAALVPNTGDSFATVYARQTATAQAGGEQGATGQDASEPTSTPVNEQGGQGNGGSDRPEGVPAGARTTKVSGHVDGDKIEIQVGAETEEVLLIGLDAPELDEGPAGECYAKEAAARLKKMLPTGRTIYLERGPDEKDNKGRLLRFVWFAGREDGQAYLANEIMLREGFGTFEPSEQNGGYDDRLGEAQDAARNE